MMSDSDFSGGAGMKRRRDGAESRFTAFVEGLTSVIGHADRAKPLHDYCTGLVMPCERKSVEPMAAVTAPARVWAQHQSLLHFVSDLVGLTDMITHDELRSTIARHIEEARRMVTEQKGRIARLKAMGVDTALAELTLRALEANLKRFQNHSDWAERKKQNPPEPFRGSSE
jgi:SRSO17 transposase